MGCMAFLEVLIPGPLTLVQDLGRGGLGRFGIPRSGAVDPFSLRAGNLLVGNREDAAGLEATLLGPRLSFLEEAWIAVTGADFGPCLNGSPFPMWRTCRVSKGDTLAFGMAGSGCRMYLCVRGGIAVPEVLGSRSTNLASGFGGMEGRALRRGDRLHRGISHLGPAPDRAFPVDQIPRFMKESRFRVLPGPHQEDFGEDVWAAFLQGSFLVRQESDRTGLRLKGIPLLPKPGAKASILSEGVIPGAIQIPGDGHPIILLNETVTGGYRKIAGVISPDLSLLGQLRPGDSVRFEEVDRAEALGALRLMEERLAGLRAPKEFS